MGLHELLEEVKSYGGTEEMVAKAGSLLERLSAFEQPDEEQQMDDREEEMEL